MKKTLLLILSLIAFVYGANNVFTGSSHTRISNASAFSLGSFSSTDTILFDGSSANYCTTSVNWNNACAAFVMDSSYKGWLWYKSLSEATLDSIYVSKKVLIRRNSNYGSPSSVFILTGDGAKLLVDTLCSGLFTTQLVVDARGDNDSAIFKTNGLSIKRFIGGYPGKTSYLHNTINSTGGFDEIVGMGGTIYFNGSVGPVMNTTLSRPYKTNGGTTTLKAGSTAHITYRTSAVRCTIPNIIFDFSAGSSAINYYGHLSTVGVYFSDSLRCLSSNNIFFNGIGGNNMVYNFGSCRFVGFKTIHLAGSSGYRITANFGTARIFADSIMLGGYLGATDTAFVYLDTSEVYDSSGWNATRAIINPGRSTVSFVGGDASVITSNGNTFFNLTVDKAGGKITASDSLAVANKLRVLTKGFFPYSVRCSTFVDSSADTCKLTKLYLTGNATFDGRGAQLWYAGASISAVGASRQVIYGDSATLPEIIAGGGKSVERFGSDSIVISVAPNIVSILHPMGRSGYSDTIVGTGFGYGLATFKGPVTITRQVSDSVFWTVPDVARGIGWWKYCNGSLCDSVEFRKLTPKITVITPD